MADTSTESGWLSLDHEGGAALLATWAAEVPEPPAYQALLDQAHKLGWPEHYRDDLLVHDREFCTRYTGSFGWSIRATGTDVFVPGEYGDRQWALAYQKGLGLPSRFFWWNAKTGKLREIDVDYLAQML